MSYEVRVDPVEDKWDFYSELKIIVDGELRATYNDNGEPEDNSFGRDWSWIGGELASAYEVGRRHAWRDITDSLAGGVTVCGGCRRRDATIKALRQRVQDLIDLVHSLDEHEGAEGWSEGISERIQELTS